MMVKRFVGPLIAGIISLHAAPAAADVTLRLEQGVASDRDWAEIKDYFVKEAPIAIQEIMDGKIKWLNENRPVGFEDALVIFRREILYSGYFDLNEDGRPELFVLVGYFGWCGTAGCITDIFEKRNGMWRKLTSTSGYEIKSWAEVEIKDDRSRYYPYTHQDYPRLKRKYGKNRPRKKRK